MAVASKLALCGLAGLLCIVVLPFRSASADGAKIDPALPKCPPGWKVEVIAETPKIKHPAVVCCAPDGRIFVAEDPMDMSAASDKPTDRILCFHPDGKTTVFAEQLYAVFGIQYIDGKLYVHHSPKFSVFTDDNGVSKERVDLIETTHPAPWTGGFNDHIPSNCRLGMDGYLYFSTGDKGVHGAKGKDGKAVGELQRVYSAQQPITKWQLLGPFANPTMEPFDVAAPPLDKEFKDVNGKMIKWKPAKVEAATGRVNLIPQMSAHSDVNCYAVTEIESPVEREVELLGGSDDYLTVWVNGKKVFEDLTDKGWKADQYRIRATLKAGKNVIVAKCGNHGGGWEFSLSLPTAKKGKLFDTVVKKLDPKAYDAFALKNTGDAEHGRKMFFDLKGVACAKCHKVRTEGSDVGPDLASVGGKYNRAQLIESLLYPSKQILDGYRQTIVGMSDGRILAGIVRGDTPEELTLIDAEGKKHVLPKKQIEESKLSDLSLMPEGLNTGMSLQDFADVMAFLESLKDKPIEPKK